MASDCLVFAQGQTATLTAQFVTTPTAMPVNVPDATVEVFGPGGAVVLAPTAMDGPVVTGLYFFDWVIPNSLSPNTYTARFSGTVMGTPTAATSSIRVEPAGTTAVQTTGESRAVAALQRYIRCAQAIPVEAETLRKLPGGGTKVLAQWNKWNLTNPIVRLNDLAQDTGFTIDFDLGQITFDNALHSTDIVDATYNFRFFSGEELVGFLNDALNVMNLEPPGSAFTLDTVPDQFIGVLLHGAAANALQSIMFCLMFQKESTIFGGLDRSKDIFNQMETLKQNHLKQFEDGKRKAKISRWPKIAASVTPEFTLPGGRSRWFRYLFSSNIS